MKILVTGGAGFIGSHIVDYFVGMGDDVVVIDNLSSEVHEQFYFNKRATYNYYDIADYFTTRELYDGVDYVYHLAAESRIQPSINNPLLAVRTNTLGTATVLQCAREANVKRVIYSSTSSAYGLKNKIPLSEDMPDDCLNAYSVSKVSGEKLCEMYSRIYGLETIIFRYFNVYGEREPLKGPYAPVVGLFLRQFKNNQPLTIVPDGEQRRDFTHVEDVVGANIRAMNCKLQTYGQIFNVGTGVNYSVKELADMISPNQIFIEPRIGESRETLADITKLESEFNWKPTLKITDYIEEKLK